MEMFTNLMEILSPTQAPKEPIKSQVIEVGTELSLRSIDGQIYSCAILVPMKGSLTRVKYILAITETQIIELYPHSSKTGFAVAAEAHDLQALVKLKFKKGDQGILLLEYKNGKVSKLLMEDPAICVGHIKSKMKEIGINGSIKNKNEKIIENATGFFLEAKKIETLFSLTPSVEYVQEMMDLLRKSAEKFAEANDNSYTDVMDFIKRFLQRSDVNAVLDAKTTYAQIPHPDPEVTVSSPIRAIIAEATNNNNTHPSDSAATTTSVNGSIDPEDAPTTPKHSRYTPFSTSTGAPHTSEVEFSTALPLPDVEAELHSLQNALTYQFDEEDHHYSHSPHKTSTATTAATNPTANPANAAMRSAEQHELHHMLDSMTNELDTLLSSFSSSSIDFTDTVHTNNTTTTTNTDFTNTTNTDNTTNSTINDSDLDVFDFYEDFAQGLDDKLNA